MMLNAMEYIQIFGGGPNKRRETAVFLMLRGHHLFAWDLRFYQAFKTPARSGSHAVLLYSTVVVPGGLERRRRQQEL